MNMNVTLRETLAKAQEFYDRYRLAVLITGLVVVLGGGAALIYSVIDSRNEGRLSLQVNKLSIELFTLGQTGGQSLEAQDRMAAIYTELESIGKKETRSLNGGRALYLAAHGDLQRGQWPQAREKYEMLFKKNGGHYLAPQAMYHSAVTLEEEGQIEKASERLREFERNYPGHYLMGEVKLNLARQLAASGKGELAQAIYEKILTDKAMVAYHSRAAQEQRLSKIRGGAVAKPAAAGLPMPALPAN